MSEGAEVTTCLGTVRVLTQGGLAWNADSDGIASRCRVLLEYISFESVATLNLPLAYAPSLGTADAI